MAKTYAELNEESLHINNGVTHIVRSKPVQKEHLQQVALMNWAKMQINVYPELESLFAIPNGGLRSKITAKRLKAEGAKAGVSDLFLPIPRSFYMKNVFTPHMLNSYWHGLWIEMKVVPNKLTSDQKEWLIERAKDDYAVFVAYNWEDARNALVKYINGEWTPSDNWTPD